MASMLGASPARAVCAPRAGVRASSAPKASRLPRGTASPAQSRTATLIGAGTQSLSANQSPDFTDLQREVALLQRCAHPHLLPLLGHKRPL